MNAVVKRSKAGSKTQATVLPAATIFEWKWEQHGCNYNRVIWPAGSKESASVVSAPVFEALEKGGVKFQQLEGYWEDDPDNRGR